MHAGDRLWQVIACPVRLLCGPGQARRAFQHVQQFPGGEWCQAARCYPLLFCRDAEGLQHTSTFGEEELVRRYAKAS